MKRLIFLLFTLLGYSVFMEQGHCDAVVCAARNGRFWLLGVEAERQCTVHVSVNARRNLERGCGVVLIVTSDELLRAAIRRQLARTLPSEMRRRVGVTTIANIQRAIDRIQNHANTKHQTE